MNSHALLLNARANSTPTKQKPTATFKHAMLKSPLRNPNTVNRNIMLLSPAQRKIALMNASPNSFLTQSPRKAIVSPSKTPRAVSVSELQINDTPQVNSKEDDEDSEMDVDENQSPNRSLANEFKLDAFESLNAPQIQNRGHKILGVIKSVVGLLSPSKAGYVIRPLITREEQEALDNSYDFVKSLPKYEMHGDRLLPLFTRKTKKKTLILDLDETLVHASMEPVEGAQISGVDCHYCGHITPIWVRVRPFAKEFIQKMANDWEIVVFTASVKPYAKIVVDYLDPTHTLIKQTLSRDQCTLSGDPETHIKDLHLLGRDLKNVVFIDNLIEAFAFNVRNGVHIKTWYEDVKDRELCDMVRLLERCFEADDVRDVLDKEFGLYEKIYGKLKPQVL